MFRRIFGTDRDNERKNAAETLPAEETSVEETQGGSQAAAPTVETAAQAEAPAAEPAPPRIEPLFSRVDEIERTYVRTPAVEPERRSGLRRFFGGEERTAEEIAREERKTEQAVQKTRAGFFGRVAEMFTVDEPITEDLWEELEELLIMADVGVDTTVDLIERVRRKVEREDIRRTGQARAILKQEMVKLLEVETRAYVKRSSRPHIILVVGVNGAGKTTLIAKIANRYRNEFGQNVLLAAADTFRAAAVEQLKTWAERVGVPVIAQGQGADPGAVAFDAVQAAHARNTDVLIIDTAGRLQAKYNLMQELQKICNVVRKRVDSAPHEVLLVVDATTGQNGVLQAKAFMEAAEITHLALTKLDGTAKGGIAFAMVQQIKRPIRYIGTGEKLEDLALFDPVAFVDALFEEEAA
jgi:fused signal recognition particle receptor